MDLDLLARLRRLDLAHPPVLPARLDAMAEWWAHRGTRTRGLVVAAATLLLLTVVGAVGRDQPTDEVAVWVATADAAVGTPVAGLTSPARRPAAHLPDGALRDEAPTGRLVLPVLAGQVVTSAHLAPDLASMVASGSVVAAVRSDQLPPVPSGSVVDVLAVGIDGVGRQVARAVPVLAVDDTWVWLGVPEEAAADVAAADVAGRLSLSRRAPTPPTATTAPPPPPDASP